MAGDNRDAVPWIGLTELGGFPGPVKILSAPRTTVLSRPFATPNVIEISNSFHDLVHFPRLKKIISFRIYVRIPAGSTPLAGLGVGLLDPNSGVKVPVSEFPMDLVNLRGEFGGTACR